MSRNTINPHEPNEKQRQQRLLVALVVTAGVSIVIPILTNVAYPSKLTGAEQVVIGLVISSVLLLIQCAYLLNEELHWIRAERSVWEEHHSSDRKLITLREHLNELRSRGYVLFSDIVEREISVLARRAELGLHGGTFPVLRTDDDATNLMLKPYDGPTDDILRMVHFIGDNDFLYDTHARDFFRDVYARVQENKIRAVRRLLVYETADQVKLYRTKLLASFHHHARGYDYKLLSSLDYDKILSALANMPDLPRDFGVYGERFAYRSVGGSASAAVGVLSCSEAEVERLTTFFDRCWDSMSSHRLDVHFPSNDVDTLDRLFRGARLAESSQSPGWIRQK